MAQNHTILNAVAVVGPGPTIVTPPDLWRRGFTIALTGVGPVSAEITIQVSNDGGLTWCNRMAFSPSGTAAAGAPVTSVDVDAVSPFPMLRANITALSSNTSVSAAVCISGDAK